MSHPQPHLQPPPIVPRSGKRPSKRKQSDPAHEDRALDEALMETFPASDPVAVSFDRVMHVLAARR